jgi:hypothetical protein
MRSVSGDMSALRDFVSVKGRRAQFELRRVLGGARATPHFMLIGAQKSGTSSMFAYLKQHPQIVRPVFKEPYYFDRHYHRGLSWYGCNFPTRSAIDRMNDRHGRAHLTFEATATYVFDEHVPDRIASDIDTRKFIVLLRDPVDRAISAYWHARRMGRETRSLDEALKMDLDWYEAEKAFEDGSGPKPDGAPPRPAYLRRGIYHRWVARWQRTFSSTSLLVLQSEAMFADPKGVMERVFEFLEVHSAYRIDFEPQNVGRYNVADADTRRFLHEFYRPHNEQLSHISGHAFVW